MNDIVITVKDLSKQYNIGSEAHRPDTFRELLVDLAKAPLNRLKNLRGTSTVQKSIWALKEVSFEVDRGEVLGIIGANGAGKTTLLKLLSRITAPTEGEIEFRGRMASLLEVGTGFHPELSGRENIFINGAILGMPKTDILKRFDEIVEFAGVANFLDTPVKRYSSGMYVRLAFAVAAYMDPDILVVDEVLAVGDAAFQKKCLGKLGEVSQSGRTVIFVSHNMGTIGQLCNSALVLESGMVSFKGNKNDAIRYYMSNLNYENKVFNKSFRGSFKDFINIEKITINGKQIGSDNLISPFESVLVDIESNVNKNIRGCKIIFAIDRNGQRIATLNDTHEELPLIKGVSRVKFNLSAGQLRPGQYTISAGVSSKSHAAWLWGDDLGVINILEDWGEGYHEDNKGLINLKYEATRS